MAVISGMKLAVSGLPSVSSWRIQYDGGLIPVVTSGTKEGALQACGIKDWAGLITTIATEPAYLPGQPLTFVGSLNGTIGCSGESVVGRVVASAEYASNRYFMIRYDIESNGALTFGSAAASDSTIPYPVCPAGKKVQINGNDMDYVAGWTLTLDRNLVAYAATDTDGVRKRVIGAFTASVELDVFASSFSIPSVGSDVALKLYTSDTEFWSLPGFRLSKIEEYGADGETALQRREPGMFRLTFTHNAIPGSGKDIVTPGLATVWS